MHVTYDTPGDLYTLVPDCYNYYVVSRASNWVARFYQLDSVATLIAVAG